MTSTTDTISPAKRALGNLIIILLGACIAITLAPAVGFSVLAVMGKVIADIPLAETAAALLSAAAPCAALAASPRNTVRLYKRGEKCCADFPFLNIGDHSTEMTWGYSGRGPAATAAELLYLASQYRDKDGDAIFLWTREQIEGRPWLTHLLKDELISRLPLKLDKKIMVAMTAQDTPGGAPDLPHIYWHIETHPKNKCSDHMKPGSIYMEISCIATWAGSRVADCEQDNHWQQIHNKVKKQSHATPLHAEQVADCAYRNSKHHLHPLYTPPTA